jgi:hypothetical protein
MPAYIVTHAELPQHLTSVGFADSRRDIPGGKTITDTSSAVEFMTPYDAEAYLKVIGMHQRGHQIVPQSAQAEMGGIGHIDTEYNLYG